MAAAELTARVDRLEADMGIELANNRKPNNIVDKLTGQVQQLNADNAHLTGQVQQLNADQAHLAGQVQQLNVNNTHLTGQVQQLNADQAHLTGQIQQLRNQVQQLQGEVDDLKEAMVSSDEAKAESVPKIQAEVRRLNEDVNQAMANCRKALESGHQAIGIIDNHLWEANYQNLRVNRRSGERYVVEDPPSPNE